MEWKCYRTVEAANRGKLLTWLKGLVIGADVHRENSKTLSHPRSKEAGKLIYQLPSVIGRQML